MRATGIRFRNRQEAGQRLAHALERYRDRPNTVVLGLPRGGVVPASEIATALGLPLDVVISRKIGAPGNPELAIGAIAEGGEAYISQDTAAMTGATDGFIARATEHQREEIRRRQQLFRDGRELALPKRATVIMVDDGVATGSTVIAAIPALKRHRPEHLVLAIPVAPPDTAKLLGDMVDELVVLATPDPFWAVGEFYDEFAQVSDQDVCALLGQGKRSSSKPRSGS